MKRSLVASLACGLFLLTGSPAAGADPPGPTDFQSEVASIDPPVAGIEVEIIGGDSFVLLRVVGDPGVVDVVGYRGEPYLRFFPDGTVEENQRSPSKYLNEERYGTEVPAGAEGDGEPEWRVVAEDGAYAWHDHRTHWMNPQPPPGLGPGDQVVEGVVPLLVDGVEVDITVVSLWAEPPSQVPVVVGFLLGGALAAASWWRRRVVAVLLLLSLSATVAGGIAYLSVPAETEPSWSLWVLPLTATLLTAAVATLGEGPSFLARYRRILLLVAALELVAWGAVHWSWLWPAILPTSLPYWLDRLIAAAVLVGALGVGSAIIAAPNSERDVLTG